MKALPRWLRSLSRAFLRRPLSVYGGNLMVAVPKVRAVPIVAYLPDIHRLQAITCQVRKSSARAHSCKTYTVPSLCVRTYTVFAPSIRAKVRHVALVIDVSLHDLRCLHATFLASHRVLLDRRHATVRAKVQMIPKKARVHHAGLQWRTRQHHLALNRPYCQSRASSLVWRLPIARRRVSPGQLAPELRQTCIEALERSAKGYAKLQSVYYPVPAHAVRRIEVDDRCGVLYVFPRTVRPSETPSCLWVVSGVRLTDGRSIRAALRAG